MNEHLRGAHLHLDCHAGIAGDMTLGALLDLGVPLAIVTDAIDALHLPGVKLHVETVRRGGMTGCRVEVKLRGTTAADAHGPIVRVREQDAQGHDHAHPHRSYRDIRALIESHGAPDVARHALAIFDRIAAVEAKIHGVPMSEVAFHELAAADSIADIVGCAAAFAWLRPRRVTCRAVPLGGGRVSTAHGLLPIPAPATLELLRGCVVESDGANERDRELTTPTGAAIVAASLSDFHEGEIAAERFRSPPTGKILGVGWGAGSRELADRPNLLRIIAIDPVPVEAVDADVDLEVHLIEANIDDMSAELAAPLVDALLAAGALDAWLTPVAMKKGRPAFLISALSPPDRRASLEELLFRESTTIGVRHSRWSRTVLDRELVELRIELDQSPVQVTVKLAGRRDASGKLTKIYSATPEFEACRRIASERNVPVRRVYELAAAAAALVPRT